MRYPLHPTKLSVTAQYIQNGASQLRQCRFVILQHLLDDTLELISHLRANRCCIDTIIGKNYSTDPNVMAELQQMGYSPLEYHDLTEKEYQKILEKSLRLAKDNQQQVVVLDIGGFFSQAVCHVSPKLLPFLAGVIEDTMYGLHKYEAVKTNLPVPVFEVVTSPLKQFECRFVGRAITSALEEIIQNEGYGMVGGRVLVIGFGAISSSVARSLRGRWMVPTVLDINHISALHAYAEGFPILLDRLDLSAFDLIISATGTTVLSVEEMRHLKDGVILASGSSQDIEFDIVGLARESSTMSQRGPELKEYLLNGKRIVLVRDGTPVNFRQKSVPAEIIDLLFAEMIVDIRQLIQSEVTIPPGILTATVDQRQCIAQQWLKIKNT